MIVGLGDQWDTGVKEWESLGVMVGRTAHEAATTRDQEHRGEIGRGGVGEGWS
jgi:hypothetical protein